MPLSVLQSLLLVPLTLLPIINPVGTAPIVLASAGYKDLVLKRLSRQVAINSWIVIVASMLIGTYVLELFGISLPVVRVGGGLLVAYSGWNMLTGNEIDKLREAVAETSSPDLSESEIAQRSFYPLTFPLTTGPGSIAASIALGTQWQPTPLYYYLMGAGVAVIGAAVTASVIYVVFRNAGRLLMRLGEVGTLVMMRMMAFVLLCIGIQIFWTGWVELNRLAR
ncbi:hypothetical protein UC35_15935 [Ramlibacter tataouinensis]|uniref:UPF0056 membrane protein n=1 Tax=Ramlibacter tataouinensis TaxID=94132 RepID=A0A127K043_9BURK|nr:hypothetical protein UC35_15935 [Ramlibacter tataouinensis]